MHNTTAAIVVSRRCFILCSSGGAGWLKVVWLDKVFEMLFRMVQPKLHIL